MEYLEINEALIAEVHESEVLYELLVYEFELPEDFDPETEILSDDQLRFTVYYQEIVQILRDTRDELEEAYDGLELIEPETEAPTDEGEEEPTDNDDELDDEDETYPNEEDDEEDLETLEEARADLREFLVYLNSILEEDNFTEIEWEAWQNLIEQANRILIDSADVDEINEILELLNELYGYHFGKIQSELLDIELLSLTRSEFDSMTADEIAEMAEEGGYFPIGVMPEEEVLNAPSERIRSAVATIEPTNTCENVDNGNIVTNVIVDGMVCIGGIEASDSLITPLNNVSVTDAAAFLGAWNNPATTVITLTNHIVLTASGNPRTDSIRIEGNGHHLVMTSRGTTAGNTVNAGLILGEATPSSTLEFNNVLMGRVITNAGGSGANAASLTGVVAGAAQPVALFTSTPEHSSNWTVNFLGYVRSSTTSATAINNVPTGGFVFNEVFGTGNAAAAAANPQSRSGILNMPNSVVNVTGAGNEFATHSTHSTGVVVFNVGEFNVVNMPSIEITGAGGGTPFAPHTRVNIDNLVGCVVIPEGETQTITTTGNTPAVNAPCLIVEENATLIVNPGTLGTAHAIQVTYDVIVRDGGTITINNRTGAGHGINARRIDFGANTSFNFSRTGNATVSGHGVSALDVSFGNYAEVAITLSVTGTTNATNVTGSGIHAPGGSVSFGNDGEINITRNTGDATGNDTLHAINTGTLTIGDDTEVNVRMTSGAVAAGGRGQGITATNSIVIGERTDVNVTRTGTGAVALHGINTGALIVGADSNLYINLTNTTGHAINATNGFNTGDNVTVNVVRAGAGNGINVIGTDGVTLGNNANITIGMGDAATVGHAINATNGLSVGDNARVNITRTGAGGAGINVTDAAATVDFGNNANVTVAMGTVATAGHAIRAAGGFAMGDESALTIIRAGAGHGVYTTFSTVTVDEEIIARGNINFGNDAMVNITTNGTGHGIFTAGTSGTVEFGDDVTINIDRTGGGTAGPGAAITSLINTTNLIIGDDAELDLVVTGNGHGISANAILTGTNTELELVMSEFGNANGTTVRGHGILAPGGVEFGADSDIEIRISAPTPATAGTGNPANNATGLVNSTAMTIGSLTVGDNSDFVVSIYQGIPQGVVASGDVVFGADNRITLLRHLNSSEGAAAARNDAGLLRAANLTVGDDSIINATIAGSTGETRGHAINLTGSAILGDRVGTTINMVSTNGHAINAPAGFSAGDNATVTITRAGAGHAIYTNNATVGLGNVVIGNAANINITTTGTGDGIRAIGGANSQVDIGATPYLINITRTGGGGNESATINTYILTIVTDNVFNITTDGNGHGIWVRDLELQAGSEMQPRPIVADEDEPELCAIDITTTTLNIQATGAASASIRVRGQVLPVTEPQGGTINLRENARVCINTGTDSTTDTAAGIYTPSHGIFGSIRIFNMEANSFMDIESSSTGFRSRISTTYTMRDGAFKNVYTRPANTAATQGRPAIVLAHGFAHSGANLDNPNRINTSHRLLLTGEGTVLSVEGYVHGGVGDGEPNRGNFIFYGNNSRFYVHGGATFNNISHNTTGFISYGSGMYVWVTGSDDYISSMNFYANHNPSNSNAAFRFLQSGSQTFNLDGGFFRINVGEDSTSPALRAFGGNNEFAIRNGGLLEIIHDGEGTNAVGVDFAGGSTASALATRYENRDRFIVTGYRSEVFMQTNSIGVSGSDASDTGAGNVPGGATTITTVEVSDSAIFVVSGDTTGDIGIFNAGRLHLTIDEPLFIDFVNRNTTTGLLFNTSASAANPSTIVGTNTDLAIWRNTRATNLEDPIHLPAVGFWSNISFNLRPDNANFANANLTANDGSANAAFSAWFNDAANLPVRTGANAGWRQIRRMNANNATPIVDVLRTPTDADQRIFGHVTIPEGNRSARSAGNYEVFVDLVIRNEAGAFVQRINNIPTDTRTVFDDEMTPHPGVFMAEIDFEAGGFAPGTEYLPAGYTVEVLRARRSAFTSEERSDLNTTVSVINEATETPISDTAYFARTNRVPQPEYCPVPGDPEIACYPAQPHNDILTSVERVRDVTPPAQVADVTGTFVEGVLTEITGTGTPGARVRIRETGNLNAWLTETIIVATDGTWTFPIPTGTNTAGGLDIYLSDEIGIVNPANPNNPQYNHLADLIPIPYFPLSDVIWNMNIITDQARTQMQNRYRIANITLPRTTITAPWAPSSATIGNINYRHGQVTNFHDAAFDYAYRFGALGVRFLFNYPDAAEPFYLHGIAEGSRIAVPMIEVCDPDCELVPRVPTREGYLFDGWTWDAAGTIPFDPSAPPLEVDRYIIEENQDVFAQWRPILTVEFLWNFTDAPNDGIFYLLHRETGETFGRPENDPNRINYTFLGWYTADGERFEDFDEKELEGNFRLYARWLSRQEFSFIKLNQQLYNDDLSMAARIGLENRLDGAQFVLYRYEYVPSTIDDEDGSYEFIERFRTAISEYEYSYGLIELLVLAGSRYRLVEVVAPDGFQLPVGHWYIETEIDADLNVVVTAITRSLDEEGNERTDLAFIEYDDTWFVGNLPDGNGFRFTKTNDYLYMDLEANYPTHINLERLREARFNLYQLVEEEWELIEEDVESDANGLVEFETLLSFDGTYQLVETRAPRGFRLPHGYWRITWDESTERFNMQAGGTISLVPAFRAITCTVDSNFEECQDREAGDIVYLVGNFPLTDLPATGGLGAMTLTLIGGLGLAFVVLLYLRGKASDELAKLEEAA